MSKIVGWGGVLLALVVGGQAMAGAQYNELEDAAVAQAKIWQGGGKAKPMMSSDGKVIFPFGQSMPKLTCSPTRACDVELQPGEKVKKVILGDKVNWNWDGAESVEHGQTIAHLIFQPLDNDVESNSIITTDRRTYHIKLYAPKNDGIYLNRVGFYYPQELVSSWEEKMGVESATQTKDDGFKVMPVAVSPEKLDFGYRVEGDGSFKPVRVFNNGEQVYLEMPESLHTGDHPILMLIDEKGDAMVVNYRLKVDDETKKIHYVVDKLFAKAELVLGEKKVKISWKKKEKNSFWGGG